MGFIMTGTFDNKTAPDFHGAAIIDDEGIEIPITEEMIVHACRELSGTNSGSATFASQDTHSR